MKSKLFLWRSPELQLLPITTKALAMVASAGIFLLIIAGPASAADSVSPAVHTFPGRERLLLDFGWKFHLGNEWGIGQNLAKAGTGSGPASVSFSDASWRRVNLPHDWVVELPFDSSADVSHGFHPVGPGFASNSVAWYRRAFELPKADASKRLWLAFDGVYRDCTVFVNGWFVGHHESGYSSFRYDITDVANCGGDNLVAVKVDASEFEGWFYEGAGIYRHVWLEKTAPVAIAPDGVFVYSRFSNNIPNGPVELQIQTRLKNNLTNSVSVTVTHVLYRPNGQPLQKFETVHSLPAMSEIEITNATKFSEYELWSPESPALYKLLTLADLTVGGTIRDNVETEFGLRTVAFDQDKGFLLNGRPYVIKGTCNHQDHAGIGAALPDALQYFRVAKLKETGANAYRTSHNAPTPELLEACDRLGMLVMDENRLLGSDPANLARFKDQILRDRNHPSVAIWSIANEEFGVQNKPAGVRVADTMQRFLKQLDPTRPVSYPAPVGNEYDANINSVIEVRGWNYHVGKDMDNYHAQHPNQPEVGTEQGSTVSTRGIYTNDAERGYVSAYDVNAPSWAHTAETWWSYFAARPWLSGGFVWTGFDYRGEPTPYSWPCINSHFGILDTCGFPKDNFYYYQSWWTDQPVLHLLPHWNWPGKEGQEIEVRALSNGDEVELFLNGKSLGRQAMKKNSQLKWQVKYAPGILSAKSFRNGKVMAETKVETTGEPAAVKLTPDRATINADGEDVSVVTVSVMDAQGRVVPVAADKIQFELSGPGKILGVGNGDPGSHEPDQFIPQSSFHTRPVEGWCWKRIPDPYAANPLEAAERFDDSGWPKIDVRSESGPLNGEDKAAYRTQIHVTAEDLASAAVELAFGMIDEEGFVYVNGQKAGESHNWQVPPVFDVKRYLHAGDNTIAVIVANWNGAGGLNKGATLQLQDPPPPVVWQRSVFNGLAQIIVQSTQSPGEIKLTAKAPGLAAGVLKLAAQPVALRPAVAVK